MYMYQCNCLYDCADVDIVDIRNAAITNYYCVAMLLSSSLCQDGGLGEWARQILNIDTTMTGEAIIVFLKYSAVSLPHTSLHTTSTERKERNSHQVRNITGKHRIIFP